MPNDYELWQEMLQFNKKRFAIGSNGRNGGNYEEKKHDRSSVDGKYGTGSLWEQSGDKRNRGCGSFGSTNGGGNDSGVGRDNRRY